MANFNVTDFTSVIGKKGLASSNKFEVSIHFPGGLSNKDMNLMCDTATIAGKTIASTPDTHYGLRRQIAYNSPTFDPLTLTFYCTEKLEEKKLLEKWQNLVLHTTKPNGELGSFDVGYYDTYTDKTKVIVSKLSVSGDVTLKYEYVEVYPKTVTSVDLSHATSSGPLKVSTTFEYAYWKDITSL